MFLTQCATDDQYRRYAQIKKSSRSDAAWGKAADVELTRDTLSSFAHPAISPDGEWIYFVSDMPGGQGGLDLWRARITPAGYGGVENLGAEINTPGNSTMAAVPLSLSDASMWSVKARSAVLSGASTPGPEKRSSLMRSGFFEPSHSML